MVAMAETADTRGIRKQKLSSTACPFVHSNTIQLRSIYVMCTVILCQITYKTPTSHPPLLSVVTPAGLKSYTTAVSVHCVGYTWENFYLIIHDL